MVNSSEMMERYLDIERNVMNKRQQVLDRFHRVMVQDPITINQLADLLKISWVTARRICDGSAKLRSHTLYKLEAWIEKQEKRLGIVL